MISKLPVIQFTKEGLEKIQQDFAALTKKRPEILVRLQTAREMGDLSENGAYTAARFELSSTDRELRRLGYLLKCGVVGEKSAGGVAGFGTRVTLHDGTRETTFMLVGGYESDPAQKKLSLESPLGRALAGKRAGEKFVVSAPAGELVYTVLRVE